MNRRANTVIAHSVSRVTHRTRAADVDLVELGRVRLQEELLRLDERRHGRSEDGDAAVVVVRQVGHQLRGEARVLTASLVQLLQDGETHRHHRSANRRCKHHAR